MTTTSPFKEGAVIQIAQGVLRGVGPMGPRGFQGIQGPRGEQGIPGPQPEMDPIAASFTDSTLLTLSNDGSWTRIPYNQNSFNIGGMAELLSDGDVRLTSAHPDGCAVLGTVTVVVRPGASGTESFRVEVGLFQGLSAAPYASTVFSHGNGSTPSSFTMTGQTLVSSGTTVSAKVRVFGAAVSPQITFSQLALVRAGGAKGPVGETGPVGPQGPVGPPGPAGDSGTGYSTFDALDSGGDSDSLPAGVQTNAQGMPHATGTSRPAVPAYLNALADAVSKRVVRRFDSRNEADTSPDREVGQLSYLRSNGSLQLVGDRGGVPTPATVAQIMWGTGDPPAGTHPAGTIYLKVSA